MDFDDLDELEEAQAAETVEADAAASSKVGGDSAALRSEIRPLPEKESVPVQLAVKETKNTVDTVAEKLANAVSQGGLRSVQAALKDLALLAQSGESRSRIVHVLAEQLKEAAGKDSKPILIEICWHICSMAFSLSGQDIDFYPGQESGPVVLVAGYAGSHIDDVRPVAERWATHYGAAVVTVSPCTDWMGPQQVALYKKIISLMAEGRQLVIHTFSNGGLQPASNLLTRWFQDVKAKKEGIPPITALRCMICDSTAIMDWDMAKFKTYADIGWGPAPTWEEQVDKLFKSLGLALFLYHGVIETTVSEFGMIWGKAVYECVQSGMVKQGMRRFAWTCAANLEPFWARVPILLVASSSDSIVSWEGTKMTAEIIRKLPYRQELKGASPDASDEVVGKDGLAVHTLFFEEKQFVPVAHAKHFKNHPEEYWHAVDKFASACLGLP